MMAVAFRPNPWLAKAMDGREEEIHTGNAVSFA
jgi:hypothetical protein